MLVGTGYSMTAKRDKNDPVGIPITVRGQNGVSADVSIDMTKRKPAFGGPQITFHTSNLKRSSGMGKAMFQVVAVFADQIGAQIVPDPSGLTGINAYRRTEQMFSALLRSDGRLRFEPGLGPRIYGYDADARSQSARDENIVRLALAGARNAAEFFPAIDRLRYDAQEDSFSWQNGQPADEAVNAAFSDPDMRAVSLSRSTLARAAITLGAMRGDFAFDRYSEIATPVLYSSVAAGDPTEAQVSAHAQAREADPYIRFDAKQVSYPVRI
jgi:hypothetical protein